MSRRIADLLIKIGADSYEFQQKAQQVERNLGSLEKRLTSLGKSLSVKLTAPLAALGAVALTSNGLSRRRPNCSRAPCWATRWSSDSRPIWLRWE